MAETVGDVAVRIGADTSGLTRGLSDADKSLKGFSVSAHATGTAVGMLAAEAMKAGAQIAAALVVKGFAAVDALDEMAEKSNSSARSLQALQLALGEAGFDSEKTQAAIKKLNLEIGQAQGGNKTAQATFDKLGLSVQELAGMDADQRFAAIGDALQGYGNQADRALVMSDLLGAKLGPDMATALAQGGDGIRQATADLEAMGLAMSDIDAAQVANAMDSFGRAGMVIDGISNQLAVEFAPLLDAVSKSFMEAGKEGGGFGSIVQASVQATIKTVAFLANAIDGIKRIGVAVADSLVYGFALVEETFAKLALGIVSGLDLIPGIDLTSNITALEAKVKSSQGVMAEAAANMRRQFETPLAGDVFLQYAADAKKASEEAAAATIAAREAAQGGTAGGGGAGKASGEDANAKKLAEKQAALAAEIQAELWAEGEKQSQKDALAREGLAKELALLDERFKTKEEKLAESLARENEIITAAREQGVISKEEADARELEAMLAHEGELSEIVGAGAKQRAEMEKAAAAQKFNDMKNMLGQASTLMNSESRKMFEIGRAAAIGTALMAAYESITTSYAAGSRIGGPILGAAFAATAGIAQFGQIANIRKQSFGGGGGAAASVSSNTGAINAANTPVGGSASAQPTQRTNVSLYGDYFGKEAVIGLLHEAFKDGFTLQTGA